MSKINTLVARCNDGRATLSELEELYEADREVTFETFFRHVCLKTVSEFLGYNFGKDKSRGLHMRNDYHIHFYRSKFRNKTCWHIDWSAIDHIFQ